MTELPSNPLPVDLRAVEPRRILVVDGAPPDREASAGERATFDLQDSLLALGHDVLVTAFGGLADTGERVTRLREHGVPVAAGIAGGPDHVRGVLADRPWDLVIVQRPGPALAATPMLVERPEVARVFWGHDIHQWRIGGEPDGESVDVRRRAQLARIAEQRCWDAYDLTVYPTHREATVVSGRRGSAGRGRAAPYYRLTRDDLTRSPATPGSTTTRPGPPACLWVGSAAHAPNLDAVRFAVMELLPRLRAVEPDARLTVVGDWPQARRRSLQRPGVVFTGRVSESELRALHYGHTCLLAPLRFGAGTRRKLVGAMGLGLPVVTTSEGIRGLLVRDGDPSDGVVVADDAGALVESVLALAGDPVRARSLARVAHREVAGVYGAEAYDRAMGELVEEAIRLCTSSRGAHV